MLGNRLLNSLKRSRLLAKPMPLPDYDRSMLFPAHLVSEGCWEDFQDHVLVNVKKWLCGPYDPKCQLRLPSPHSYNLNSQR